MSIDTVGAWAEIDCEKSSIMRSRLGKDAGCGALSAFLVESKRRSREGDVVEDSAERAICACARVGGLKEESRMNRDLRCEDSGLGFGAGRVCITLKDWEEEENVLRVFW